MESAYLPDRKESIFDLVRERMKSTISKTVDSKVREFKKVGRSSKEKIFEELCFCILAANTSAKMGLRTQNYIGYEGFAELTVDQLAKKLKSCNYRFYNVRSDFITRSRWIIDELPELIRAKDKEGVREYLVGNVPGIGYKEASHFLRNVGIFDFAILDKHIIALLRSEFPKKTIKVSSRYWYLSTEKLFRDVAASFSMEPGILDLYLWEIATGKVIK